MAEEIKKIVIPAAEIPNLLFLRYRLVSEDRNQTSHWSPMFRFEKDDE
jgi:hypothetical protein